MAVNVALSSIKEEFFVRLELDQKRVEHFMQLYKGGTKLPPILVSRDGVIIDGRHRVAALKALDKSSVDVEWMDEADRGKLLVIALQSNLGGAQPPTNEDIVYAIEQMFDAGMIGADISKQFPWPSIITNNYLDKARLNLKEKNLRKAKAAVISQGKTVEEAAVKFNVPLGTLKDALAGGKKKRKTEAYDYKGGLTELFRSKGGAMGQIMRKIQSQWENNELSWDEVDNLVNQIEKHGKDVIRSGADWRKRLKKQAGLNGD